MMTLGVAIAVTSAVMGFWAGITWRGAMMQMLRDTHKKEMDEIFEEIKRLRAQVANLIGRE